MIISQLEYEKMYFPAGEMHIKLKPYHPRDKKVFDVEWNFEKSDDIIELLLFCNAMKEWGIRVGKLTIPYVPFGRQDRVAVMGECFSLRVFADLVNGLEAESVEVWDPHSDVIPALIKNCRVFTQWHIFSEIINTEVVTWGPTFLISPDGGALKKIYKLAPLINHCTGVIECSKLRDVRTGEITDTKVYSDYQHNAMGIIVDDICDGGRTFIEIAKKLKELGFTRIVLCVTHGLFTKGLDVFDGLIDELYTRHGRVTK